MDRAELLGALEEARATIAERDEQLAFMVDRVAGLEAARAARAAEAAPVVEPPAAKPAEEPRPAAAPDPREAELVQLAGLAILAREGRHPAPRAFWDAQITRLGELLAPDATPAEQERAALGHPTGQDLLAALQASRA
jgi:hypothetical protein